MKTFFLTLSLAVLTVSCSLLNPELPLGEKRDDVQLDDDGISGNGRDTVMYMSVVKVPDSYDWRRDSSAGNVCCTLLFYRNNTLKAKMLTGPDGAVSPQPDRHHIIGGRLFTEYSDQKRTVIKRDGETLYEWQESSRLMGFIVHDGKEYSLSCPRNGSGFTYRCDGKVVLKKNDGSVFGGFNRVSYDPNGALYLDGGRVCFAYKTRLEGQETVYVVRDGTEELAFSGVAVRTLDAKSINGKNCMAVNDNGVSIMYYGNDKWDLGLGGFLEWQEGGLLMFEDEPSIAGFYKAWCYASVYGGIGMNGTYLDGGSDVAELYVCGNEMRTVGPGKEQYEDYYLFSRGCGTLLGKQLYLALSPRDPLCGPCIVRREMEVLRSMEINGYISAFSVRIE